MAVSEGFLSFVLEQLESLRDVSSRRMFGGVGLYAGDVFFAVLDNDTLFFKVDERSVGTFRDAGMPPFQPYPDKPATSFNYYQVPVRVLEDSEELATWARTAVDVARRRKSSASRSRGPKKTKGKTKRKGR